MKYSYSDSLITLAAAVTQACSLNINMHHKTAVGKKSESSLFLNLITHNQQHKNRVGIKFDNISAGKYFVLIHQAQRHIVMSKVLKTTDKFLADSNVTRENELTGVLGRNEPSVLCQSTFL